MRKKISKVAKMMHGHLCLEFEDGTKRMVYRGDHEAHNPQVGDLWPPEGHEHVSGVVQNNALRPVAQNAPPASLEPAGEVEGAGKE